MRLEKSVAGALILIKMDGILTAPSYEFGYRYILIVEVIF